MLGKRDYVLSTAQMLKYLASFFYSNCASPSPETLELCAHRKVDDPELVSLANAAPRAGCADLGSFLRQRGIFCL